MIRNALSSLFLTHKSISPVALTCPCAASAYAPTIRYSTFSSEKADSMSRKSGLSKFLSLESPGIERKLPHHRDTLGRCCSLKIRLFTLLVKPSNPDVAPRFSHSLNITQTSTRALFHPVL